MTSPLDPRPFQQLLLQQRQDLLQQLAAQRGGANRVEAASAQLEQSSGHDQAYSERELELILDDRETAEIAVISAALKRIDDGSYGVCVDCGCDIPPARLLAAPEAARCVSCQSKTERGHAA